MDFGLKGRVALVAAGSQGLGRAAAHALAAEGASVALFSRDAGRAGEAAADIAKQTGQRVLGLGADVSNADAVQKVIERCIAELGRLDVLVTNAGGPPAGTFGELSEAQWTSAFESILLSAMRLIR